MLTKLKLSLTLSVIASIMIIGGVFASPDAYSDRNHDDVPDECKCEKPHTLTVLFEAPDDTPSDTQYIVEIFKKLDDRNDKGKQLGDSILVMDDENITVFASNFGKDKLESNTAFVIYEADAPEDADPVALLEIHTSCSKPLFIGIVVDDSETTNNGYSLEVKDGLSGDPALSSIPIAEPIACEDEKKKSTGSITIKKAITNDNGGKAIATDFEITITNVDTTEKITLVHDNDNPLINLNNVPAGSYTISETPPTGKGTYTTVLIAGDTGCPSILEEVFTIKKNKHLSCTIYNDDNGDGSTSGPGGIIFQNESLQILIDQPLTLDSCDNPVNPLPCVQIVEQGVIAIVDPVLGENTNTIILFSVVEDEINKVNGAIDPKCTIDRLIHHSNLTDDADDTNLTVLLDCPKINSFAKLNVNYVMIDPTNTS